MLLAGVFLLAGVAANLAVCFLFIFLLVRGYECVV